MQDILAEITRLQTESSRAENAARLLSCSEGCQILRSCGWLAAASLRQILQTILVNHDHQPSRNTAARGPWLLKASSKEHMNAGVPWAAVISVREVRCGLCGAAHPSQPSQPARLKHCRDQVLRLGWVVPMPSAMS